MTLGYVDLGIVVDPAVVFRTAFASDASAFWLDGGPGETSYLGRGQCISREGGLLADLKRAVHDLDRQNAGGQRGLGLVGWLDYGVGRETTGVDVAQIAGQKGRFIRVDEALAVDEGGAAHLLLRGGLTRTQVADRVQAMRQRLISPNDDSGRPAFRSAPVLDERHVRWRDSGDEYLDKIRLCQRYIADGEAYQLCLTTRADTDAQINTHATYSALRQANGTHRSAHIRIGGVSILSSSPEQFLSISAGRRVRTSPIKGTRPRSADPHADRSFRDELLASEKECAENVMIVDLMRNDLGRVCELGSVRVSRLLAVESYPQVHQLVSTIEGCQRLGLDAIDVVAACFPAGSMTGAPRIRAMQLLDEIESSPRGAYSGAYGYFGFDGSAELSMTIRAIISSPGHTMIGTGGGITTLSDPQQEIQELHWKARALVRAIRLASSSPRGRPVAVSRGLIGNRLESARAQ